QQRQADAAQSEGKMPPAQRPGRANFREQSEIRVAQRRLAAALQPHVDPQQERQEQEKVERRKKLELPDHPALPATRVAGAASSSAASGAATSLVRSTRR